MFLCLFLVLMGICGAVRQVISNDVGTMQKGAAGGGYVCECWTGGISKKYWSRATESYRDCQTYCDRRCQQFAENYGYRYASGSCNYESGIGIATSGGAIDYTGILLWPTAGVPFDAPHSTQIPPSFQSFAVLLPQWFTFVLDTCGRLAD
ncbi:unnamed protein product, partial [Symbiodinium necroappetens]